MATVKCVDHRLPILTRGMCLIEWKRWYKPSYGLLMPYGKTDEVDEKTEVVDDCVHEGCDRKLYAKERCHKHYNRMLYYRDADRIRKKRNAQARERRAKLRAETIAKAGKT